MPKPSSSPIARKPAVARDGRPRATGACGAPHYGPCTACARARKRRQRAKERKTNDARPTAPLDALQRQIRAAREYVRTYLRRGAIVPPDACDRCECDLRPTPHRDSRPFRIFHPDPQLKRDVAWLCMPCYKYENATREPIALTWRWPGTVEAPSRRRPNLADDLAIVEPAIEARLATSSPSMRYAAIVGIIVNALPSDRERLFADGVRDGRTWSPTGNPDLDLHFREWVSEERLARGRAARAAGGPVVQPIDARPRKLRAGKVRPAPPTEFVRTPFDSEAQKRREAQALESLVRAELAADDVNARVSALFEAMRARRATPNETSTES